MVAMVEGTGVVDGGKESRMELCTPCLMSLMRDNYSSVR